MDILGLYTNRIPFKQEDSSFFATSFVHVPQSWHKLPLLKKGFEIQKYILNVSLGYSSKIAFQKYHIETINCHGHSTIFVPCCKLGQATKAVKSRIRAWVLVAYCSSIRPNIASSSSSLLWNKFLCLRLQVKMATTYTHTLTYREFSLLSPYTPIPT